jgi:prophage antirepressor-like protein
MSHARKSSVRQAITGSAAAPRPQSIPGCSAVESEPEQPSGLGTGPFHAQGPDASPVVAPPAHPRLFNFDAQGLRVVGPAESPWFVAKDVCAALGIGNSREALSSLDDDEKGVSITDTLGGPQELATVNESGLYALIFRSRKPEARLFRKWVTGVVLPAIRKTGSFERSRQPLALTAPAPRARLHHDVRSSLPVEHARRLCQAALAHKPDRMRVCLQWVTVQAIIEHAGLFFWLADEPDPLRRRSSLSRYVGNFRCIPFGVIGGTVQFDAVGTGRSRYYVFERKEAEQ